MNVIAQTYERVKSVTDAWKSKYRMMTPRERSRFLVLSISLVLLADYLMFCYLADKNIFNIFPALPRLDFRTPVHVYVPDRDAKSILKETRRIRIPEDKEVFAAMLYRAVSMGSMFDNTAAIVPVKTYVRYAWVRGDNCVIDIDFDTAKGKITPIPGSYEAFVNALEKTMKDNIPGVKNVYLVVNGVKRSAW